MASQKHSAAVFGFFLKQMCVFSVSLVEAKSSTPSPDENADVDGLCIISEICPALCLKCRSSFALQLLSLRLEEQFGAGRGPQSVHAWHSLGNCSSKWPDTLMHAAGVCNC